MEHEDKALPIIVDLLSGTWRVVSRKDGDCPSFAQLQDSNHMRRFEVFAIHSARATSVLGTYIREGHLHSVEAALATGARLDTLSCSIGQSRSTPLHLASFLGKKEIVGALLKAGGHVNIASSDGRTALYGCSAPYESLPGNHRSDAALRRCA